METSRNRCYMEYSFIGTGITVLGSIDPNRRPFSCSVDNSRPTWFTGYGSKSYNRKLCSVTGLENGRHTIRLTNSPLPANYLGIDWMTVEKNGTSIPGGGPALTSELRSYNMPAYPTKGPGECDSSFTSPDTTATGATTATSSSATSVSSGTPSGVVIGVTASLTFVTILSLAIAFLFFRRSQSLEPWIQKLEADLSSIVPYRPTSLLQISRPARTSTSTEPPSDALAMSYCLSPANVNEFDSYGTTPPNGSSPAVAPPRYSPVPPRRKS